MEWRCEWCGKPQAEDDPPCDECGHHKFEKAIEQFSAETVDPQEPVWVCTECGREHQKHSPPCSRCGHVDLEKRQPDYSDLEDLGGTSYLDVLEPKYAAGYVAVALLGGVLLLAAVGVISLPTIGGPSVPDAPGHADAYGNASLADVEAAYLAALNDRRAEQGLERLESDETVTAMAATHNKRHVAATDGSGTEPSVAGIVGAYEPDCERITYVPPYRTSPSDLDGAATPPIDVAALADALQGVSFDYRSRLWSDRYDRAGVDVHVGPDDDVYVTVYLCG